MTPGEYNDKTERHRVRQGALRAEFAGLHAQLEDLRQSKTVAALGQVASDASALLRDMSAADECGYGPAGFNELRSNLAEALAAFAKEAKADLAIVAKRTVELEHGPLFAELASEEATEDAVCPECHGTKKVLISDIGPGPGPGVIVESSVPCPRCQSDASAFARGMLAIRRRDASKVVEQEMRDNEAAGRAVELRAALGRDAS